jgi:hypothetical protein
METIQYWNSMLTLAGEIGIGIAGFSSVIVALALAGDEDWRFSKRTNLNMLLVSSGTAIFFSLLPFYLLEIGFSLPNTWAIGSGLYFVFASGILMYRVIRQSRALDIRSSWPSGVVLGICLVLSAANAVVWKLSWPFLTIVYWQLLIAFLIFGKLLAGIAGMREPTPGEIQDLETDE